MKIKISSLIKWGIYISILVALSLIKPLGELFPILYFDYGNRTFIIIMAFIMCLLVILSKGLNNRYLIILISYVISLVFIRLLLDWGNGRNVYKEFNANTTYYYIILAVPVFYMLYYKKIKLEQLIDIIIFFTVLSYILRTFISAYYGLFHERILFGISIESATDNWFRNGRLRINPPCFGNIIITLSLYRYFATKGKKKIYYVFVIIFALYYSAFIHCSRALVIYQLAEILLILLIKRKSQIERAVLFCFFSISTVAFIVSGAVTKIFVMFTTTNLSETFGYSNASRALTYKYYFKIFLDNFYLGKGFLIKNELLFQAGAIAGDLSDVGILRTLLQMGIGMLVFYIIFVLRGLSAGMKALKRKTSNNLHILAWGIVFSIMITGVNIDCFYPIYAFSIPFALAIIEYILLSDQRIYSK